MGVTYETGIPHQVLPVTKGVRYVAVFWTKSIILDSFVREIYHSLNNIQQSLINSGYIKKEMTYTNIKEYVEQPDIEIEMLKKNLIRRYL